MENVKCPQIENLQKITPEQAAEYVRFVATLRHEQRRFFTFRKPEILETCKQMEKELDALKRPFVGPHTKVVLIWLLQLEKHTIGCGLNIILSQSFKMARTVFALLSRGTVIDNYGHIPLNMWNTLMNY